MAASELGARFWLSLPVHGAGLDHGRSHHHQHVPVVQDVPRQRVGPRLPRSAAVAVMALRGQIEQDNDHYRETIINFEVVADNYLTEFEKDQLEYEGRITYPAKELVVV